MMVRLRYFWMMLHLHKKQEEKKKRKLRVAAYCRVSTDTEEQQTSYELQARYYTNLITQNPDWELVGIFADEESGGSTRKRKEFNRMLELCRQGKIDRIITKTVSRFARNTLDTIQTAAESEGDRGIFRSAALGHPVGGKRADANHVQ